jgi:hypothetical protein
MILRRHPFAGGLSFPHPFFRFEKGDAMAMHLVTAVILLVMVLGAIAHVGLVIKGIREDH